MTEANHSPLTIHDALRDSLCPRPANGEPDDQTVGACFDRGKCGCQTGAALDAATSLHAELVAALEDTIRMLTAVQFSAGLGRKQLERFEKARAILQKAKQR